MEPLFYTKLAQYYDKIYEYIDYNKQSKFILKLIRKFKKSDGNSLLDVACGTGNHIKYLKNYFKVVGVDKNKDMLEVAEKKNPQVKFVRGDMKTFNLKQKFDVLLCYFNSILYNKSKEELYKTLKNFSKHIKNGGVLIFNTVDMVVGIDSRKEDYFYKAKNLNIVFSPQWVYKNKKLYIDIDFLIENGGVTEHLKDNHVMGAFSFPEIKSILEKVGFEVHIFETNYEELIELSPESWQGVFVCRKR